MRTIRRAETDDNKDSNHLQEGNTAALVSPPPMRNAATTSKKATRPLVTAGAQGPKMPRAGRALAQHRHHIHTNTAQGSVDAGAQGSAMPRPPCCGCALARRRHHIQEGVALMVSNYNEA